MTTNGDKDIITVKVSGGDGWFRAYCPEIDVYGGGETKNKAIECCLESAILASMFYVGQRSATELHKAVAAKRRSPWDLVPELKLLIDGEESPKL